MMEISADSWKGIGWVLLILGFIILVGLFGGPRPRR